MGAVGRRSTWSFPLERSTAFGSNGSCEAIARSLRSLRRKTGTSKPSASASPLSIPAAMAPSSPLLPDAENATLPLFRKVATSSKPISSNAARSAELDALRVEPRFTALRKAA